MYAVGDASVGCTLPIHKRASGSDGTDRMRDLPSQLKKSALACVYALAAGSREPDDVEQQLVILEKWLLGKA